MATDLSTHPSLWTVVDIAERFGPIPVERIVNLPRTGTATVDDVVRLDTHEDRLCELIDGVLVEKTVGYIESFLALQIAGVINEYLKNHNLGIAGGADGMMQLFPGQVRIPDASFVSWTRLEGSGYPDQAAPSMVPDLAVEVLSTSNTDKEMQRKLQEYFQAGVRLVWYVDPRTKTVVAYTSIAKFESHTESDILTGGEVLPGLEISLKELFTLPMPPAKKSSDLQDS